MELLSKLLSHGRAVAATELLLCGLPSAGREQCALLHRCLGLTAGNSVGELESAGHYGLEHGVPGKGCVMRET